MPRTAKVYHQHITPEGRVLKCENPANCPYKGAIHIEATLSQAKFMQETLAAGKKVQDEKLAQKAKVAAAKASSSSVETSWNGDKLVAYEQANGRYDIKLANGTVLAKDQGLITGVTREAALKDWAENMAPFGATPEPFNQADYPSAENLTALTVWNEDQQQDVHIGYVFFSRAKNRGWTPILSKDELKSQPVSRGLGLLGAAADLKQQYEQRESNRAQTPADVDYQIEYRVRGARPLDVDAADRVLGRRLMLGDVVYEAKDELTARVRNAFNLANPNVKADLGDKVYLHEVRDADNEVESLTVKWGARSWAHEEITFDDFDTFAPYDSFNAWLSGPELFKN